MSDAMARVDGTVARGFDRDILAQGNVIARLLETWPDRKTAFASLVEALGPNAPVLLTGMGASLGAISIADPVLRAAGRHVSLVDAGELTLYGARAMPPGGMVLAASQTGLSRETVAAANVLRGRGSPVVALVNDVQSPLANAVDLALSIDAGPEDANACKTFTATQALALLVASVVSGRAEPLVGLAEIPAIVDGLATAPGLVDGALQVFDGCGSFALLGHGPAMSAARYGALMAKEMLALPGEAGSVAEFRHGPVELVARGVGSIVVALEEPGRDVALELAWSIASRGGRVWLIASRASELTAADGVLVTDLGPASGPAAAIAASVPLQRFFAQASRKLGRAPGYFAAFDPLVDTGRGGAAAR